MVRTRDFLLFVVVFIFILSGIAFTVSTDLRKERTVTDTAPQLAASEGVSLSASTESTDIDRASNLAALREKILRGEGEVIAGAPVFTSVDTPSSTPIEGEHVSGNESGRVAQYCPSKVYSATALLWNLGQATLVEAEGARLVHFTKRSQITQGTSTIATTTTRTALQLPTRPVVSGVASCLDSEFVGVALDGSLINNNESWRYRNYAAESVIGYARDGFPIYGQGVNEEELDACGGYADTAGYRYHIRADEPFVIGCYSGTPVSFIDQ